MNEDKVIQKKLVDGGYRIAWALDSIAYHGHNYSLKSLKIAVKMKALGGNVQELDTASPKWLET